MLKIAYIEAREERSRSLDRVIGEFYPHKRQAFCASTGLFFLAWMAEELEVYVIFGIREGLHGSLWPLYRRPRRSFIKRPRLLHS